MALHRELARSGGDSYEQIAPRDNRRPMKEAQHVRISSRHSDVLGFAVDEPVETPGRDLKPPSFLEPRRNEIEAVLPTLETAGQFSP